MFSKRIRAPLVWDALLAAATGAAIIIGTSPAAARQGPAVHPVDPLAEVLMGIAAVSLTVRRLQPLATLGIIVTATAAYLVIGYPYGPMMLAVIIATYTVGAEVPTRLSLVAFSVSWLAVLVASLGGIARIGWSVPLAGLAVAWTGWLLVAWGLGLTLRLRRSYIAATEEREIRSREAERRRRDDQERLLIARELHDVVGHSLAAINMQASVALHVMERRPENAKVALEVIKRSSKDALEELRGTLDVFRRSNGGGTHGLGPGLKRLKDLVATISEGGRQVKLVVSGDPVDLSAAVDLAAYRIVQESVTNVLRHAGPAAVTVLVKYGEHDVTLEVTDNGTARIDDDTRTSGHGIVGMRERAGAVGGTLEAGPRAEGGFRVYARLPAREGRP